MALEREKDMDLFRVAVIFVRLQGVIFLISVLYNLGYAHRELYALFRPDISPRFLVIESWMFIARQVVDLVAGFVFLKHADRVAVLLTRGLAKMGGVGAAKENPNSD